MLVALLVAPNGSLLMSSIIGVPQSTLTALRRQGIYSYEFHELHGDVITAIVTHFNTAYADMLRRADSLIPGGSHKPRLTILRPHMLTLHP